MTGPQIVVRSWVKASEEEIRTGLIGYISVFLGDLIVDGIALRRTAKGRMALSFPARTSRRGHRHPYVRPVDDQARQHLERQIFKALGLEGEGAAP